LRRTKFILYFSLLCLALPQCGDFRAIFNGNPPKVAKPKKKKEKGREVVKLGKGEFIWPLGGPVTSGFGPRNGRNHDGIDIDGEEGDPIVAAAEGTVVYSDRLGGYGNLVVIKHRNGLFTAYAHNKKNLVEEGDKVRQGQLIGRVGNTGSSTGDHLHFEVRNEDGPHNPMDFLPPHRYSQK
jgi:murein DD-endopeptidase MepM/ murein hydrolase activator NlpD